MVGVHDVFSKRTELELSRAIARYGKKAVKNWIDVATPPESKKPGAPRQAPIRLAFLAALYRSCSWRSKRAFAKEVFETFRIEQIRTHTKHRLQPLTKGSIKANLDRALSLMDRDCAFRARVEGFDAPALIWFLSTVASPPNFIVESSEFRMNVHIRDDKKLRQWIERAARGPSSRVAKRQ
jgi:hypothetical protein